MCEKFWEEGLKKVLIKNLKEVQLPFMYGSQENMSNYAWPWAWSFATGEIMHPPPIYILKS
jgi:hypothetical protein